ncbi:MAG TPA: hypothetical protein VN222_09465 [Novosphingobium sp.]|nr:hypothetical protein [Novosphingobium sp.]
MILARIVTLTAGLACYAVAATAQVAPPAPAPGNAATFPAGAGQPQVQAACTACHPAAMVTGKRFSAEKWGEVVDQMIDKGAKVSDADYEVIVAYLARNYGAAN